MQWDAFRAQGTGAGLPDQARKRRKRLKSDPMCCCQFASCVAVHRECCDSNGLGAALDRKSTRLNSSHSQISYAVFCLKKKQPSSKAIVNVTVGYEYTGWRYGRSISTV